MHQVLAIPELLFLIVEQCTQTRSSLASLARTCRTFTEASTDALYGSQEVDLVHIVKCLPFMVSEGEKIFDFDRNSIETEDKAWERFDYLATKIKYLTISFENVSDAVFDSLFDRSNLNHPQIAFEGLKPLFPRLQTLDVNGLSNIHDGEIPPSFALCPYLTSSLTKLVMTVSSKARQQPHNLPRFGLAGERMLSLCPKLKTFSLYCGEDEQLSEDCQHLLANLPSTNPFIENLVADVFDLSTIAFEQMLSLSRLKRLKLNTYYGHDPSPTVSMSKPCLSSLETLDLTAMDDQIVSILASMDRPKLREVCLYPHVHVDGTEPDALQEVLEKLVERTCTVFTRKLQVGLFNEFPVTLSSIDSIFAMEGLQELHLSIESLTLTDSDVHRLSQMLTQLHILEFQHVEGLTLQSLISLSRNCSRLEVLEVVLDATRIPEVLQSPTGGSKPWNTDFWQLKILNSPIDDSIAVGSFLRKVFPTIWKVDWSNYLWEKDEPALRHKELWHGVAKRIKKLRYH